MSRESLTFFEKTTETDWEDEVIHLDFKRLTSSIPASQSIIVALHLLKFWFDYCVLLYAQRLSEKSEWEPVILPHQSLRHITEVVRLQVVAARFGRTGAPPLCPLILRLSVFLSPLPGSCR